MSSTDLFSKLRKFDAYPKTLEDFRIKTFTGAAVSITAGAIITFLFISELNYFISTEVQPELFVDTSRNEKMRINVDIVFPEMPCAWIHLDVMDVSGEQQLDVEHNIYKKRLNEDGSEVDDSHEQAKLGQIEHDLDPDRCESCYGAESSEKKCCNTCKDVREAYQKKGWALTDTNGIVQCEREGWKDKAQEQEGEGCTLYGFIEVNKVSGNFHLAPGKSFQQHSVHIHDLQSFGRRSFNMTHTIRRLTFGHEYPGLVNPLDDHTQVSNDEGSAMYQYFIKVVPTKYTKLSGMELKTNQYSVTSHKRVMNHALGESGLPGVFFMFELSPIVVQLTETRRSLAHFLTSLCAIIGGVFTVAGMIDSVIFHSLRSWQKKNELGKLG
eukprot:m.338192 g.338192  ORF g.338192 m.338192 type:complete len:382 (+) comp18335_c0_seq1:145-1290(+)